MGWSWTSFGPHQSGLWAYSHDLSLLCGPWSDDNGLFKTSGLFEVQSDYNCMLDEEISGLDC